MADEPIYDACMDAGGWDCGREPNPACTCQRWDGIHLAHCPQFRCLGCAAKDRQIEELDAKLKWFTDEYPACPECVVKDRLIEELRRQAENDFAVKDRRLAAKDEEIRQLNAQKQATLDLLARFAHTDKIVEALTK